MYFRGKHGISVVISTVVIVAVVVAVSLAVAFWGGSITMYFTRFDRLEVLNSYATRDEQGRSYNITIRFRNSGSADTTIIDVFLNGRPLADFWSAALVNGTGFEEVPVKAGESKLLVISLLDERSAPLAGWRHRKSHTILGTRAGPLSDYQVNITVHYGAGVDSGNDVYLNGSCKADFSDVRFTAEDGATQLSYWVERKVDGDYALFWVKVPSIPASPGSTKIYIYYGNSNADTAGNMEATFEGASHFTLAPANEGQGAFKITGGTYLDTAGVGTGSSWHGPMCSFNVAPLGDFFFRYTPRQTTDVSGLEREAVFLCDSAGNIVYSIFLGDYWSGYSSSTLRLYKGGGRDYGGNPPLGSTQLYSSGRVNTWNSGEFFIDLKRVGTSLTLYSNGAVVRSVDSKVSTKVAVIKLAVQAYSNYKEIPVHQINYFFIRKHVSPEPSHGAWGAEEDFSEVDRMALSSGQLLQVDLYTSSGKTYPCAVSVP